MATTKEYLPELAVWKTTYASDVMVITVLSLDEEACFYHSVNDLPSHVIMRDGVQPYERWHQYGIIHRDGDKPAEIDHDGTYTYYKNGQVHRELGLPAVSLFGYDYFGDDYKYTEKVRFSWCLCGNYSRPEGDDGPVEITRTRQSWYIGQYGDDKFCHRTTGPAIINSDGTQSFYLNGIELAEEQFNQLTGKAS